LSGVFLNLKNSRHSLELQAHNSYLLILAEGGGTQMFVYLSMLVWLLVEGGRSTVLLARKGEMWGIVFFSGFLSMSLMLWSLSSIADTVPWIVYGCVAAIIYRARKLYGLRPFAQGVLRVNT
jgi:hypothetical protein